MAEKRARLASQSAEYKVSRLALRELRQQLMAAHSAEVRNDLARKGVVRIHSPADPRQQTFASRLRRSAHFLEDVLKRP